MLEFAYGELGLTPVELAELTPFDFELKVSGHINGLERSENNFRKLAWITFALNADPKSSKGTTIDEIWPVRGTKAKREKTKLFSDSKMKTMMSKFKTLQNKRNGI